MNAAFRDSPSSLEWPRFVHREAIPLRCANKQLLVGHYEHAVPIGRWVCDEIFLTSFQVNARRAIFWPLLQNFLKRILRGSPLPLAIEFARSRKSLHLQSHCSRRTVRGKIRLPSHQLV